MIWMDDPEAMPPNCDLCRATYADGLLDDQPRCIDCADRELERWILVHAFPDLRETMVPLFADRGVRGF